MVAAVLDLQEGAPRVGPSKLSTIWRRGLLTLMMSLTRTRSDAPTPKSA